MKNIRIQIVVLLISIASFGQSNVIDLRADESVRFDLLLEELFSELDVSDLETEFLLDKSPNVSQNLFDQNGTANADISPITGNQFDAFYSSIRDFATVRHINWPVTDKMMDYSLASSPYNELGFRVLIADVNRIKENAADEDLIYMENEKIKRRFNRSGNAPFIKEKIVLSAPFHNSIITSGTVRFNFNDNLKFTNNGNTIDKLEIDFNDGAGYADVTNRSSHTVSYSRDGSKIITSKITSNGEEFYSKSKLLVNGIDIAFQAKSTIFGKCYDHRVDISVPQIHADPDGLHEGKVGASAYIRYGCGNEDKLRKPIIFVEGIDFGDKNKYYGSIPNDEGIAGDMFYDNDDCGQFVRYGAFGWDKFVSGSFDGVGSIAPLPDAIQKLHSDGYDVILLDFKAGATHIQNNAETLIDLLNYVNTKLSENGSVEQSIVTGISMGGQVVRYALRKMENENKEHNVKTFVSIDSPNSGANIPLGLQYNIRFASFSFVGKLQPALLRPATKQLLLYHYKASKLVSTIPLGGMIWNKIKPNPHELHTDLYTSVHMTTFPQKCRNVAISNGSKHGANQGYQEGDLMLHNLSYYYLGVQSIKSWAMLETGDQISVCSRTLSYFPVYRLAVRTTSAKTYDHIPGGYRTTSKDLGDGLFDAGIPNYPQYIKEQHAFIPTYSGLGISESYKEADLPTTLGANYPYNHNPNLSPFDVIYADAVNHKHVFMDAVNTTFLMEEYTPNTKYVQNKTQSYDYVTHSARDEVIVGENIDPVPNRSLVGDVLLVNDANTIFYAGKKVTFNPGFKSNISLGRTHAYIHEYCDYTQGIFKLGNPTVASDDIYREQNMEEKYNKLQDTEQLIDVRLYPNPNKGTFKIDLDTVIENVVIYNMFGQVITSKVINSKSATINIDNLDTGIYIAKIKSENKVFTKRFSVVK